MKSSTLKRSAQNVQEALERAGLSCEVKEFPATTRSARDAAKAIGCEVAEIAKSLIFRSEADNVPILVIASGKNRVAETKIESILGIPVEIASPDFVKGQTGYAIGGVPPLGHKTPITTVIDEDLMGLEIIWAAAGTPNSVFSISPEALVEVTQGKVANVLL